MNVLQIHLIIDANSWNSCLKTSQNKPRGGVQQRRQGRICIRSTNLTRIYRGGAVNSSFTGVKMPSTTTVIACTASVVTAVWM